MAANEVEAAETHVPIGKWLPVVLVGWIVPGGGHLMLKKYGRAGLILG